jgi:hypothetical protein
MQTVFLQIRGREFRSPHCLEYGAVFTSEHDPDRAGVLRVGIHAHAHRKPHMVATATHYLLTELGPV